MNSLLAAMQGAWILTGYRQIGNLESSVPTALSATLQVEDAIFEFYAGCNTIRCTYDAVGDSLTPLEGFMTAMGCDREQETIELIFSQFLDGEVVGDAHGGRLTLTSSLGCTAVFAAVERK